MSILQADSILKSFRLRPVLTDVYISCKKGEIIGLLGRNGNGKSTLLKIIFGTLKADQKFVKVGDKQLKSVSDAYNVISYLPQESFLPNHIRLKTIISIFCNQENGEQIIKNPVVEPLIHKTPKELSSGQRRFIEILLIIFSESHYALIDEPFKGLSPIYKDTVKQMITKQSKSKGFIITDHDYQNILDISSKIVLLHDGGTRQIRDNKMLVEFGYLNRLPS